MRIGIDLRDLAFPVVGVGQATLNILACLQEDKDNEYFFYQYSNDDYCKGDNFYKKVIPVAPYAFLREQICLSARSSLDKLDVFHAPIHIPPLFVSKKTKTVFTVHDIHSELDYEYFPPQMNKYFIGNRLNAIKKADAVIVHTEYVKNVIMDKCGVSADKLHLITRGVCPDFKSSFPEEKQREVCDKYSLSDRFVLYVGSVEPWKEVPLLIKEFLDYLKNSGDDISLVIVGQPGWNVNVCREVECLVSQNRNVQWLNYVGWGDLPVIYSLATVFSSATRWEGFGLIFLEAMASGVPIVASDKACVPEVVGEAGLVFDSDLPGEFGDKLSKVLNDDVLYNELRDAGLNRAKKYDFYEYGKRVHELYLKI